MLLYWDYLRYKSETNFAYYNREIAWHQTVKIKEKRSHLDGKLNYMAKIEGINDTLTWKLSELNRRRKVAGAGVGFAKKKAHR